MSGLKLVRNGDFRLDLRAEGRGEILDLIMCLRSGQLWTIVMIGEREGS